MPLSGVYRKEISKRQAMRNKKTAITEKASPSSAMNTVTKKSNYNVKKK